MSDAARNLEDTYLIDAAVEHLDAVRYARDTVFAYRAAETRKVYLVDDEDMADAARVAP